MLTRPAGRGKGVSRARLWVNVANALAYIVPLYAFIGYCFLSGDAWSATPNAGMRAHKHDRDLLSYEDLSAVVPVPEGASAASAHAAIAASSTAVGPGEISSSSGAASSGSFSASSGGGSKLPSTISIELDGSIDDFTSAKKAEVRAEISKRTKCPPKELTHFIVTPGSVVIMMQMPTAYCKDLLFQIQEKVVKTLGGLRVMNALMLNDNPFKDVNFDDIPTHMVDPLWQYERLLQTQVEIHHQETSKAHWVLIIIVACAALIYCAFAATGSADKSKDKGSSKLAVILHSLLKDMTLIGMVPVVFKLLDETAVLEYISNHAFGIQGMVKYLYDTVHKGILVYMFAYGCLIVYLLAMCFTKVMNWEKEYSPKRIAKMKQHEKDFHNNFLWLRCPGCEYDWVCQRFCEQIRANEKLYGNFQVDFRGYLLVRTCKVIASVTQLSPKSIAVNSLFLVLIRSILLFPAMKVRVLFMASLIGGPLMLTSIMLTKMQDMLDQTTMAGDYENDDPYERDEEDIEADVEAIKRMARWVNYKIFFEVMFLTGFNITYAHFLFTDWSFLLLILVNIPYIYLAHSGNRELIFHLTVLSSTEYLKDTGVLAEQRVKFASRMVLQSMFGLQAMKVFIMRQLVVAKNLNKPGILVKLIQRKGNKGAKVEAEIDYTFDLLDEDKGGELDVDELAAILSTVGLNLSSSDKLYLFGRDLNSIQIGRPQFKHLYHEATKIVETEPKLVSSAMFDWLDEDGGGHVSFGELIHKFTHTRVKIRVAELLQILEVMDENGDGEISRDELGHFFLKFCNPLEYKEPSLRAVMWRRFKHNVKSMFGVE